jgi:hypothetical protein
MADDWPRREWRNALGIEADKEQLVAEPEGKVLQHRRVKMRPQPVDRALTLLFEVPAGGPPALGEIWRNLVYWDFVHSILPDSRPRRREPWLA